MLDFTCGCRSTILYTNFESDRYVSDFENVIKMLKCENVALVCCLVHRLAEISPVYLTHSVI